MIQFAPQQALPQTFSPQIGGGQVPFGVSNLIDQEQPTWNELLAVLLQLLQNQQQMTGHGGAADGGAFPISPGAFGSGGGGSALGGGGGPSPVAPFLGGSPGSGNSNFGGSPFGGSASPSYSSPPSYGSAPVGSGGGAPVSVGGSAPRGNVSDVAPPSVGAGEAARAAAVISDRNPNMKVGQLSIRDPQTGELHSFEFRNGGSGRGHIPDGTYTVDNGRRRSDVSSMMVDGYGYSFDLTQEGRPRGTAQDPRYSNDRTLLRVHPDGGGPGTLGCIGIVGDRATQERFYEVAQRAAEANGGSFQLEFGQPRPEDAERPATNPEEAAEAADGEPRTSTSETSSTTATSSGSESSTGSQSGSGSSSSSSSSGSSTSASTSSSGSGSSNGSGSTSGSGSSSSSGSSSGSSSSSSSSDKK